MMGEQGAEVAGDLMLAAASGRIQEATASAAAAAAVAASHREGEAPMKIEIGRLETSPTGAGCRQPTISPAGGSGRSPGMRGGGRRGGGRNTPQHRGNDWGVESTPFAAAGGMHPGFGMGMFPPTPSMNMGSAPVMSGSMGMMPGMAPMQGMMPYMQQPGTGSMGMYPSPWLGMYPGGMPGMMPPPMFPPMYPTMPGMTGMPMPQSPMNSSPSKKGGQKVGGGSGSDGAVVGGSPVAIGGEEGTTTGRKRTRAKKTRAQRLEAAALKEEDNDEANANRSQALIEVRKTSGNANYLWKMFCRTW